MYTSRRTNQGGSVVVFLIVSVILAAGVIGGIYAVQQRGAHVRTNDEQIAKQGDTQQSQQKAEDTKNADDEAAKKQAEQQAADKKAAEQKQAQERQQAEQKKADADKKAAAEEQKRQQAEQQSRQAADTIPQTSTAPAAGSLPHTGPEESFIRVIGGATLLGILIAYLKSYRHRFGSLLR